MNHYFFWVLVPVVVLLLGIYFIGCWRADLKRPYAFKCLKKREAFERWHDHQIAQLGAASNTLFALATAAFAYSLNILSQSNQAIVYSNIVSFRIFTSAFAVSFILGLICIFNRLEDFRRTAQRHKLRDKRDAEKDDTEDKKKYDQEVKALYKSTRRIGYWTWGLFYSQGISFLLGGMTIIYFWLVNLTQ